MDIWGQSITGKRANVVSEVVWLTCSGEKVASMLDPRWQEEELREVHRKRGNQIRQGSHQRASEQKGDMACPKRSFWLLGNSVKAKRTMVYNIFR